VVYIRVETSFNRRLIYPPNPPLERGGFKPSPYRGGLSGSLPFPRGGLGWGKSTYAATQINLLGGLIKSTPLPYYPYHRSYCIRLIQSAIDCVDVGEDGGMNDVRIQASTGDDKILVFQADASFPLSIDTFAN
jgi:hypothetical protein